MCYYENYCSSNICQYWSGFDSVGVAVSKYLTIEVLEPADVWFIEHDLGDIPSDENNLLISTALQVKSDLQPHKLVMTSDIPLARGLGSSSSVIVAGIELANQLADLKLSDDDKLDIATKIEGHPDNVAPAIFGNLVVASYVDEHVNSIVTEFPECAFVAFIPSYELKTSESRGVLPSDLSYKDAVAASSIANVAIAALFQGIWLKRDVPFKETCSTNATVKNWLKNLRLLRNCQVNTVLMRPIFQALAQQL